MKAKYKGPSGTGILEFGDETTVDTIFNELKSRTGIRSFQVKYGPPMAMKTLDSEDKGQLAKSFGLHGETLTIVPDDSSTTTHHDAHKPVQGTSESLKAKPEDNPEDINIPWPEREGTLCEHLHSIRGPFSGGFWRRTN
jgi:ubiquitin thioesterase OTU1